MEEARDAEAPTASLLDPEIGPPEAASPPPSWASWAASPRGRTTIGVTVLAAAAIIVAAVVLLPPGSHTTTHQPMASPNDDKSYKSVVLDNGLQVLLVHDPLTDTAGASIDVGSGSWSDPPDLNGLAHFTEHMMFLGSEEFPEEDAFSGYLASHGGSSNAFTAEENTNFFFSCDWPFLAGALDRFGAFFKSPLLTPDATTRELKAVDSENAKNQQSTLWRLAQLTKSLSTDTTALANFGTGSKDTLLKPGLNNALQAFVREHYVSTNLRATVLGRESLSQLQALAVRAFAGIPRPGALAAPPPDSTRFMGLAAAPRRKPTPAGAFPPDTHRGILVKCRPVGSAHELHVSWPLPSQRPLYRTGAVGLVAGLLGGEGVGSVLSYLMHLNKATALSVGLDLDTSTFALLKVAISLNDMADMDMALDAVFAYINLMKEQPEATMHRFWNESIALQMPGFLYPEHPTVADFVSDLAAGMRHVDIRDVLHHPGRLTWNFTQVRTLLTSMTPQNAIVMAVSSSFKDADLPNTEPNYKNKFAKSTLDDATRTRLTKATLAAVTMPRANVLLPPSGGLTVALPGSPRTDFSGGPPSPALLVDDVDAGLTVWHSPSVAFRIPKVFLGVELETPVVFASARDHVLTNLYLAAVRRHLTETAYMAQSAGGTYSLSTSAMSPGIVMTVSGWSHVVPALAGVVSKALAAPKLNTKHVEMQIKHMQDSLRNAKLGQPFKYAAYQFNVMTGGLPFTDDVLLEALGKVKPGDLEGFADRLLARIRFQVFAGGDITKKQAAVLVAAVLGPLQAGRKVLSPEEAADGRAHLRLVPHGSWVYQEANPNAEDNNSATMVAYQSSLKDMCGQSLARDQTPAEGAEPSHVEPRHPYAGLSTRFSSRQQVLAPVVPAAMARVSTTEDPCLRHAIVVDALRAVMQEPAFDTLRTKETLGYLVFVRPIDAQTWTGAERGDVLLQLAVIVQSSSKDAAYLDERIQAFVGSFESIVRGVSQKTWRTAMRSVRSSKLRRPLSVASAASHHWAEIMGRTYRFQRQYEEAAALEDVSVDEVVDLFKTVMLGSTEQPPRKVAVEIFGKGTKQRAPTGLATATPVANIAEFRNSTTLV